MVLPPFSVWMTVWHSFDSLRAHLAHFASPVMVTLSFAANVRKPVTADNNATPAINANDFFITRSFWLGLLSSALADIESTAPNRRRSKELAGKIRGFLLITGRISCPA